MIPYKPKMKTCKASGCENKFIPTFSTIQPYCSSQCAYNEHNRKQREKPKVAPKPIRSISKKRSKENSKYLKDRIDFLNKPENKICPVTGESTTEIHHQKGRIGKLLLDQNFWLAVSRKGHQEIESNPEWAKEKGFSFNRL